MSDFLPIVRERSTRAMPRNCRVGGCGPGTVLLASALALSGCAVGPRFTQPIPPAAAAYTTKFMVPSIMPSGFATPIANMPPLVQDLTLLNPMRHFLIIVRGVFLEGAPTGAFAPEYAAMAAVAGASLFAAGWLFRRRAYGEIRRGRVQ